MKGRQGAQTQLDDFHSIGHALFQAICKINCYKGCAQLDKPAWELTSELDFNKLCDDVLPKFIQFQDKTTKLEKFGNRLLRDVLAEKWRDLLKGLLKVEIKLDPELIENSAKKIVTVANVQEEQIVKLNKPHTQAQPDNSWSGSSGPIIIPGQPPKPPARETIPKTDDLVSYDEKIKANKQN